MNYELRIKARVEKDLKKIPNQDVVRILEKISGLINNPYPPGAKKVKAFDDQVYRIRQGSYRILYQVEEEIKIIEVRKVGHRKDVYD